MSVQTAESYKSFESYEATKTKRTGTQFQKVVFATVIGIGYVIALAAFFYPVYMHVFVYD